MNSYQQYISTFSLLVISSVLLTACETVSQIHLGPKLGIKIPIQEDILLEAPPADSNETSKESRMGEPSTIIFSQLDNNDSQNSDMRIVPSKSYIGTGKFTARQTQKAITKSKEGTYSINFDAADIGEISKIILSDMLHENYILNPKVKGSITLQTTKPLTKDELLPTLEMLLRMNGAVLVKREGIYRIEPGAKGIHSANTSLMNSSKLATGYQVKVIPLEYVGVTDMAEIIKPIVPKEAIVRIDPARNILFVAGTREELEKIIDLINIFDVNYLAGMSFGFYPLENTEVDSIVADIENIFNKGGETTPLSGMLRFISIKHLNAILVVSPQKVYLREAEKWIRRLDQQNGVIGEGGVIVYKVQYVDATELATTLNSVISGIAPTTGRSISVAPGQRTAQISNKGRQPQKKAQITTSRSQGNTSLEGINIIADEPNNALIILAEPQQYRMLSKIIKHLDVMPLQVLIDATIVAVKLEDNLAYGVKWLFKNSGPDGLQGLGILGTIAAGATAAASGGFSYGLTRGTDDIRLVFNALAKDDKVNVLSSPSLMILNNQEATIKVGDSVPIRTTESTNTGGSLNPIQTSNIEMLDTGVILTVKPRVNASGMIILEIDQSVDNAIQTESSGIDSPTILKRQIQTTVTVVDGESVVLGGLISEEHSYLNTGIPFLKDIPYLGWLFGTQGKKVVKNELIVVITPRVVANKFDARKLTDEYKRKLTGIYYDQDVFTPGSDQLLRGYDGIEIQTEEQREAPLVDEE